MHYVKRFEDGKCCRLAVNPNGITLIMYPAGQFEGPEPIKATSLTDLLEWWSLGALIHPDLQDFVEAVWFRITKDRLESELIAAPLKTEMEVGDILYRKTEEHNWRTTVAGAFSLGTTSMAERLAAEEFRALFATTLDCEEVE